MEGKCDYCPVEAVQSDLAKRAFFIIECPLCGAYFYSVGGGKRVPGWDEERQELLPTRQDVVVFADQANYRAWQAARKKS